MRASFAKILFCLFLAVSTSIYSQSTGSSSSALNQNTIGSDHHKILSAAVEATQLDDVLENAGPFTIFAPSDAAFERFSSEKINQLINSKDKSALKSLVAYHIVAGHLTASRILRAMCRGNGKASFTTIQGKKLLAHMEGFDIVLTDPMGNTARITTADVNQRNTVIHEIDSVILPAQM